MSERDDKARLITFAREVLDGYRTGVVGDIDGGWLEDRALALGLLAVNPSDDDGERTYVQAPWLVGPPAVEGARPEGVCDQCGKPMEPREALWFHPDCLDDNHTEWLADQRPTPSARLDEIARECSDVLDDVVERWQGTDAQIKAIIRRALDAALDAAREIPR